MCGCGGRSTVQGKPPTAPPNPPPPPINSQLAGDAVCENVRVLYMGECVCVCVHVFKVCVPSVCAKSNGGLNCLPGALCLCLALPSKQRSVLKFVCLLTSVFHVCVKTQGQVV